MTELTLELVNKLFSYDDKTGDLIRKVSVRKGSEAGQVVGCDNGQGYLRTGIKGHTYFNHRIIFLMHKGYLPPFLDHKTYAKQLLHRTTTTKVGVVLTPQELKG
jgi:hypothetical protein